MDQPDQKKQMKPRFLEFARKAALAYSTVCKPLCTELGFPRTAFDILMFLANNPEHKTARDIVELRHIKANLVSVNVEKLVHDGYLVRRAVPGDRRKAELCCTEKALPIIERGRELHESFFEGLFAGMDDETRDAFFRAAEIINENLDSVLKEK